MQDVEDTNHDCLLDVMQGWYKCPMPTRHPHLSMRKWLEETDGHRYFYGGDWMSFEREQDLILFQLTWC